MELEKADVVMWTRLLRWKTQDFGTSSRDNMGRVMRKDCSDSGHKKTAQEMGWEKRNSWNSVLLSESGTN